MSATREPGKPPIDREDLATIASVWCSEGTSRKVAIDDGERTTYIDSPTDDYGETWCRTCNGKGLVSR
jgi:hypothetical protein